MAKRKAKKPAGQAPPEQPKDQAAPPVPPAPSVTEPKKQEPEPKKRPQKKDEPEFKCRGCKNYPLRGGLSPTTSFVEGLRIATNNGRKTYCGTIPVRPDGKYKGDPINPKIDCTGKKFELDES